MDWAIFGDIHGNWPALEAVWADMDARGIDLRYCLGDLVGYGVQPNEVITHVRSSGVPVLMGNYDQGVGYSSDDCGCAYKTAEEQARGERSIAWTNQHVRADHKRYLRNLPMTLSLMFGSVRMVLVHGSPRKINEYLYAERPEASIERLFDQVGADLMVCGHTHLPYDRTLPSGRRLINAGSVGKPKDGDPRAGYLLLRGADDARAPADVQAEIIRVPYDIEAAATLIEASAMPHEFATMLRLGRG